MLCLLCALVRLARSKEGLNEAVRANITGFAGYDGELFVQYVCSDAYSLPTWKLLCNSYMQYLGGDRYELQWNSSDWFCTQAVEERTHPVCEFDHSYAGPKRAA